MARTYGIRPWEMTRLTPREYSALVKDINDRRKQQEQEALHGGT